MKNLTTKALELATLLAVFLPAAPAHAGRVLQDNAKGHFFVTNNVAGCYPMGNIPAPAPYFLGLYINTQKGDYDSYRDQRVYLWLNSCSEAVKFQNLKGQQIYAELKPSAYSSNWDPDFKVLCLAEGGCLVDGDRSPRPIEFVNQEESSEDLSLSVTSVSTDANMLVGKSTKGELRVYIYSYYGNAHYFNSRGQHVFEQSLSLEEKSKLQTALEGVNSACPVDITISRKQRRVTKLVSKCVPFN